MPRQLTKQRQYFTGLVAVQNEAKQTKCPISGAGWQASFVKPRRNNFIDGQEVLILASSWISAQRALNLILASIVLISGDPPLFDIEGDLLAHNATEPEFDDTVFRTIAEEKSMSTPGIPLACRMAGRASRRQRWIYAITKYKCSVSLFGVHLIDLLPFRSQHLPVSQLPDDHIRFSSAIMSAHSILEDLGLDIRASHKNPSSINGKWNPSVKQNLEKRLSDAGVNFNEPILWTVRGPKRKIEKKREVPLLAKAPWSSGPMVRDCEIQLIDAIAYADWLRDYVASHKTKKLTKVLSPYDVVNVQHLARRLIMETMGFWRSHQENLENDPRFLKRIEQARKSLRAGAGIKIENI